MSPISKASRFLRSSSRLSWTDQVISWILPAAFFLLPAFFFNISWQGASFDRLFFFGAFTIVGLAVWLAKVLTEGSVTWHWRRLDWVALATFVAAAIATFWSSSWRNSLFGGYGQPMRSLAFFAILLAFYFLVVNNWSETNRRRSWLAILISFSFVTIYSTCQLFGLYLIPVAFTKAISFNPVGSLTNLALFFTAALPLFLLALDQSDYFCERGFSQKGKTIWNIWLGLSSLAIFIALTALGSFTIWPIVILGVLLVLIFGLSRTVKLTSLQLTAVIGSLALSVVLLIIGNFGWLKLTLPNEVSLSNSFSWQIAKQSLANRPILGNGLASFGNVFTRFKQTDFNAGNLWNLDFDLPSGWLAESLVIVGGLGTLLLLALLLGGLFVAWRRIMISKEMDEADSNFSAGLLAAVVVLLAGGLMMPLGNNIILIFALLWTLLMVVTYSWPRRQPVFERNDDRRTSTVWIVIIIVVAIGLLASAAFGGKLYLADVIASNSTKTEDTTKQIGRMANAYKLAPWREMYGFGLAQLSWLKANQIGAEAGKATGTEATALGEQARGYVQQAKQLIDGNFNYIKNQPAILKTVANMYETIGDFEGVLATQGQLIKIDGNNPWPYAKIAQVEVSQAYQASEKEMKDKLVSDAFANYNKAIELKPNWAEAYYYRAALNQAIEKPEEATKDLVQAVNYSGGEPSYVLALAQLLNQRAKTETDKAADLQNQAEQIADGLMQQVGNDLNGLYLIAGVYRDAGKIDKTKEALKTLLAGLQDADKEAVKQQFAGYLPDGEAPAATPENSTEEQE
ncbi:MAG TPA: hypothetical protein PLT32_00370 [bacterium]|nr:hypothetical protein [bacterium]